MPLVLDRAHEGIVRLFGLWWLASATVAQSTNGSLSGLVLDSMDASVADTSIVVTNISTNTQRRTRTTESGYYVVASLVPGVYEIKAERRGFEIYVRRGVPLGVAENLRVDIVLTPAVRTDRVEVVSRGESTANQTASGTVIHGEHLRNLPINGRDFARLSLLAPGALVRTTQIADLTFDGMQTAHNQFTIDGVDATRVDQPYLANGAERGARLLTGSMDSIAEFRVDTSVYPAEYGRVAGAYVNIATRSGGHDLHGMASEYLRNNWFDARNFFNAKPSPQTPFRYNDFGGNLSGPIRRDTTFFFVNYEGSRQRIGVLGSGTVPSGALRQRALLQSPALAPILAEMPDGTGQTDDQQVSLYSTESSLGVREDTGSVKINHLFSSRNSSYLRVNANDSAVRGPLYSQQPAALGLDDSQAVPVRTANVAAGDQHVFGVHLVNDLLVGMQRVLTGVFADGIGQPLVQVTGLTIQPGSRGRTYTAATRFQSGDSMTYSLGSHLLKWGGTYETANLVQRSTAVTILTYTSLDSFVDNHAGSATQVPANPGSATRGHEVSGFFQDLWRLHPTITFDYGIRYDYFGAPFDPQRLSRPFYVSMGALAAPGASYFSADYRNFAPRVGLAWEIREKLLVRAGYGRFYNAYPLGFGAIAANILPGSTTVLAQQASDLRYPVEWGALSGTSTAALPAVTGFTSSKRDLYGDHWNTNVAWRPGASDAMNLAYIGNAGRHLSRTMDINLLDSTGRRPNPNFSSINLRSANGSSSYHAFQAGWSRNTAPLQTGVYYVWSHGIDDVQDPAVYGSTQPQNNADLAAERGNSSGDTRHRVTGVMTYELPVGRGTFARGWKFSAVGFWRTGIPQTVLIGFNTSGTGNLLNQRPDAVAGGNPYAISKSPGDWLNKSAFRTPAPSTFGDLGRNTVYGPSLAQLDLEVMKEMRLREHAVLRWRAQAFNVLNHPAFAQPNNVFGTAAFGKIFNTLGNTIGLGTARQIQIAATFEF